MARKRKTLPKDFQRMLTSASLTELVAVYDTCELDAYGGYRRSTALGFRDCPDELIVWLVEQGLDVDSRDSAGRTALADRAQSAMPGHVRQIGLLLSLGADIEATGTDGRTPFQNAVLLLRARAAELLAEYGAAVSGDGWDPTTLLELALGRVENATVTEAVPIARLLVARGASVTDGMRDRVERIGASFEHYRDVFAADKVDETDAALRELYAMFDVEPVARRVMHDGSSPIVVPAGSWREQHAALWELLVPGTGAAATRQGEVIRITGKVADEMFRNGGANWGPDYRAMIDAVVTTIGTQAPLSPDALAEARDLGERTRTGRGADADLARLTELAVDWVTRNPEPLPLGDVPYAR
ncbi:ankyrin repeat domain-containing protein [Georgenia sp. Z1491]|uniref:ankyrin repeat domain-containing protein n=1 Tax=Georgenia sp. Z1491 TaxID=3416707 RepID=UPI003CF4E0B4